MVEVSKAMMKSRNATQQRDAVISGFPAIPAWFRRLFPYSKWGAEANAWITPTFFAWLVGPMEIEETEIAGVRQRSQVHIKRCRYLAESGCAGMCVNLCKSPTQEFFTTQLGMPLTMQPNFQDYSCKMIFGQRPPALQDDEATTQSCLQECSSAQVSGSTCHKLR
ncbi:hypothetical protein WJX74_004918 [Apatococcus lobatus]|uniref:Beta-carotene isomerase D27-like C-terminal domain-containing protein n=1 Tax=Apatococcus lobatus TaxID=904363 RepID=A0AAW1S3I5_9CHLO